MNHTQQKIQATGKKAAVILKAGSLVSATLAALALFAICILLFPVGDTKASFLSAFDVKASNGTIIPMAPGSLLLLFGFMLADSVLITFILFFVYSIFRNIAVDGLPFTQANAILIRKAAVVCLLLGLLGSCSDSLVDYYTIGALGWNVDLTGLVMGLALYCLSLIFAYGCDLQQLSDETL